MSLINLQIDNICPYLWTKMNSNIKLALLFSFFNEKIVEEGSFIKVQQRR